MAMSLEYLSNFWPSPEMLLIDCKVNLELKWENYWVLSVGSNDNTDLYRYCLHYLRHKTIVTLSVKDNQKDLLSKGLRI